MSASILEGAQVFEDVSRSSGPGVATAKAEGAFLAFAAGDALGWPQEMRQSGPIRVVDVAAHVGFRNWKRRSGGRFQSYEEVISAGEYSDDTQLTLAVSRSRTNHSSEWWNALTRTELPLWMLYERGGGGATKRAAAAWASGCPPWRLNRKEAIRKYFAAGGNGVAMRVLPHALFLAGEATPSALFHDVILDGSATHGHPRALVGASVYAYAAWWLARRSSTLQFGELLEMLIDEASVWSGFPKSDRDGAAWFEAAKSATETPYDVIWNRTAHEMRELLQTAQEGLQAGALADDHSVLKNLGCFGRAKGAGTSSAAAAAYLAARYAAQPVQGVLTAAFEKGADTDTLAAMAGGLMGCLAGVEWLPAPWFQVQDARYLRDMAHRVVAGPMAAHQHPIEPLPRPQAISSDLGEEGEGEVSLGGILRARATALPDPRPIAKSISVRCWRLTTSDGQTMYVTNVRRAPKATLPITEQTFGSQRTTTGSTFRHSPIEPRLLSHLKTEFGSRGERAVEFLHTASELLASLEHDPADVAPRIPDTVAYCLREAMTEVMNSQDVQGPLWKNISREVVDAKRRYAQTRGFPGTDASGALADLLRCIDEMAELHRQEGVHERRLIDVMVHRTGARPVSNAVSRDYQKLVSLLSSGLHGSVSAEQAKKMWSACVDLLGKLFLPPDIRSEQLAALAQKDDPSDDDVAAVKKLLVTPIHLRHFLGRVRTPIWLKRLTADSVLDPPDDGGLWPVFGSVGRLARQDPDAVVDWLTTMYGRIRDTPECAWMLGLAALDVGEAALPLVLCIARRHPDRADMVDLAWRAARIANPSGRVFESFADVIFNQQSSSLGPTFEEVAERLVSGAESSNALRRAELLCFKIRATPPDDVSRRHRETMRDGSIAERLDRGFDDRFEVLLQALVKLARRVQRERWLETPSLLALMNGLPGLIGPRMRVWLLSNGADVQLPVLVDEVTTAIAQRNPTGDDLKVIHRVTQEADDSQYIPRWRAALGPAPRVEDVGRALAANEPREEWMRAYFWSPLLPGVGSGSWSDVLSVLAAKYGLSGEYLSAERPQISVAGFSSPFSHEELRTLQPLDAADKIAKWRPGENPLVSARILARTLERVVTDNPGKWTREPLIVAMRLRHPTYIQHYLCAVTGAVGGTSIPVDELISLLTLLRTHPWETVPLGRSDFDFDLDWSQIDRATIDIIKALADSDIGFDQRSDEVWQMIGADVQNRSQTSGITAGAQDPLDRAINRPCTRALDALLACMACEFRKAKSVRLQALRLLEQPLRFGGDDGLQFRAIIALGIGFLHHIVPGWVERFRGILFGEEAPDGLGQKTLDQTLKWGQPNRWLLEEFADGVRDAVCREVEHALDRFLVAVLRRWSGYNLSQVEAFLGSRPKLLAQAGNALGGLLSHERASQSHIAVAVEFWQLALENKRAPDGLRGFGWLAQVKLLDDPQWAEFTAETLERTDGRIDGAYKVTERVLESAPSRTTLRIMDKVVRGADTHGWYVVERDAVALIGRSAHLADTDEYRRLQTALLERGAELGSRAPERSA